MHASDLLVATGSATAARLAGEYPGRAVRVVVPGADGCPSRRTSPRHPVSLCGCCSSGV